MNAIQLMGNSLKAVVMIPGVFCVLCGIYFMLDAIVGLSFGLLIFGFIMLALGVGWIVNINNRTR